MPAEPLWAFLRFSPLAYFPRHCVPCSELLICSKRIFLFPGFSFPPNLPFRLALSHNPPESKRRKILFQDFSFCPLTFG